MARRTIPKGMLVRLYVEQGLSGRDVARELGCDKKLVYSELARHNVPQRSGAETNRILRSKLASRECIAEGTLREMYEDKKLSVNCIADQLKVSASTVTRRMDELGIPRRSLSEANWLAAADQRVNVPEAAIREMYEAGLSAQEIARQFDVSENLIMRRMREYGIETRPHAEATTTYSKTDFSGDLMEKAYLVGFRLGDLWVGRQNLNGATISISCSSTKQAQIDLIQSLFQDYGRVWIGQPDKECMISVTALVNNSFAFLLIKQDAIEDWILSNDECFWAFFAGLVDAEGNIGVYSGKARLRIGITDENILFQAWKKLNTMGVPIPRPSFRAVKGKPVVSTPRKGMTNKDQWELATNRKSSLTTIFEHVAPYLKHADRKRRMEEAIANIRRRNQQFGNRHYNRRSKSDV